LADKAIFRLVGGLVKLPRQLSRLTEDIVEKSSYALTPLGLEIAHERPTSVDQLRSTSKATEEFLDKPLNPNVRYFSVIGSSVSEGTKPLMETTDNVVPYFSSHIGGVESEYIVYNSPHGLHKEKEGIREIGRILKLP